MSESVRKQKPGDQLAVGDWIAPEQLTDLAAEVLYTTSYPGVGGTHVLLVLRQQGKTVPFTDVVAGDHLLVLASDEDLAEYREAAERAAAIADIRAFADWLEANPRVPMPYMVDGSEHLDGRHIGGLDPEAALAKLREVADRLGVKADESLDDRTKVEVAFGRTRYQLIAWHPDGRPAEPNGRTGAVVDEPEVEPVTRYFSFGHGQTDPDTGADLVNRYVTVIAPTADACREAMFASRYGKRWAFEYIPGTPQADEWIPRWNEHERIDAMPTSAD